MKYVVPAVRQGGVSIAYVMVHLLQCAVNAEPNLNPPVTSTEAALAYKKQLEKLEPNVKFLMTLYLSPSLTVEEVKMAKQAGVVGVIL